MLAASGMVVLAKGFKHVSGCVAAHYRILLTHSVRSTDPYSLASINYLIRMYGLVQNKTDKPLETG